MRRVDVFAEGGGSFFDPGSFTLFSGLVTGPGSGPTFATASFQDSGRFFVGPDIWLLPHDAVQVSYAYSRNDLSTTFVPISAQAATSSLSMPRSERILSFDYLHAFPVGRHWEVLAMAGPGIVWWVLDNQPGSDSFAVNVGAGVVYRVSKHWSIRAEYRDFVIKEWVPPLSSNSFEEDHSPTIGIAYRF